MRTLTSRSPITSYLRSDVDHWVVNICSGPPGQISNTPGRGECLARLTVRSAESYAHALRGKTCLQKRSEQNRAHHRSTLLSQHRALDQIPGTLRRSAGEVLEPRLDSEKRS